MEPGFFSASVESRERTRRGSSEPSSSFPLTPAIKAAVSWYESVAQVFLRAKTERRWVTRETVETLLASRPAQGLVDQVRAVAVESSLTAGQTARLSISSKLTWSGP